MHTSPLASIDWQWWFTTDAGLAARIAIGAGVFAVLAGVDLLRDGRKARRWREYAFLLAVVAAAMAYGLINDAIASGISWEYFAYGKGLGGIASAGAIRWPACMLGMKASFSAGLLIAVAMLIANNPRKDRRALAYRELAGLLGLAALAAIAGAGIGAAIGWAGRWNRLSPEFAAIWREGIFRPRRFMAVFGMNLGGYAGTALGAIAAVVTIVRRRKKNPRGAGS